MSRIKPEPARSSSATRQKVLDAAERLLGDGKAAFSMRELASAAGVSFATPFNQFGSKLAIMQAISARRIEHMHARTAQATLPTDAVDRVLYVVEIAAAVMRAQSAVNRAVMGAIGAPGTEAGDIRGRSRALWEEALGTGEGLAAAHAELARAVLPDQLAIAFRGVLSFWTAGEISDSALASEAIAAAAAALFGFAGKPQRNNLADLMAGTAR